jgi:hypothetical protein
VLLFLGVVDIAGWEQLTAPPPFLVRAATSLVSPALARRRYGDAANVVATRRTTKPAMVARKPTDWSATPIPITGTERAR